MPVSGLSQRRVLLGITGGIAAYKAAELARALVKEGCAVQVVLTEAAKAFVTPLTLQALSGRPVRDSLLDPEAEAGMGHIELARWAELVLIAPASADSLARIAAGQGDDLLTTVLLATAAPIHLAPAMNQQMWAAQATQDNLATLKARGFVIHGPDSGDQACGDQGLGRMLEPDALLDAIKAQFAPRPLEGQRITLTAGPTLEPIDPVRFISNRSSGKMGFALAQAAADMGARVRLISGPVHLPTPEGVERIDVETAEQMLTASQADPGHVFIGCAAVCDYRPEQVGAHKLKKEHAGLGDVRWVETPDIVATIARSADRPEWVIGFAAETQDELTYGQAKLSRKNLDAVLVNRVGDGLAFGQDSNALTWIDAHHSQAFPTASKRVLAEQILHYFVKLRETRS